MNPDVRQQHPSTSKFANRGIANGNRNAPLPEWPTDAHPGTLEKIAVLEARVTGWATRGHDLPLTGGG